MTKENITRTFLQQRTLILERFPHAAAVSPLALASIASSPTAKPPPILDFALDQM